MNTILLILIMIALVFISINLTKYTFKCPKKEVIYKYIPKKTIDAQFEDNYASDLFKTMFTQTSPWVNSLLDYDRKKSELVNKYFIDQI